MSNLVVGDLNNDGFPDVAAVNPNGGPWSLIILMNHGNGSLKMYPNILYNSLSTDRNYIALADVNNDGNLDIVMTSAPQVGTGRIFVFAGYGNFTFKSPGYGTTYNLTSSPLAVLSGDIRASGKADICVTSVNDTKTASLSNYTVVSVL